MMREKKRVTCTWIVRPWNIWRYSTTPKAKPSTHFFLCWIIVAATWEREDWRSGLKLLYMTESRLWWDNKLYKSWIMREENSLWEVWARSVMWRDCITFCQNIVYSRNRKSYSFLMSPLKRSTRCTSFSSISPWQKPLSKYSAENNTLHIC